jgi:hypothetical protein
LIALALIESCCCTLRILAEKNFCIMTKTLVTIVISVATFPLTAWAQGAPAARDFMNTPVDAASFFADFLYNKSETASSSGLGLPNNETASRIRVVTILYSFPMFDRYAGIALGGGYTGVEGTGPLGDIKGSGFTDPAITFHINLFGAPALRKEGFAQAIPKTFSSFHLTVNAPLGSYDRNSPVNTGSNRWAFNPLFNLDITPDKGVSYIDIYAGARFYTNNNAFRGDGQLSQRPLANFAVHYSHNIGKKMYAAIGVYYDNGGQTSINNVPQANAINGFRPGVAISRMIWKYRVTLRLERSQSTPNTAGTNGVLSLRVSGFLF